jgi:hypothetical protein
LRIGVSPDSSIGGGSEAATAAELQGRFRRRSGTDRNSKWYLFAPGRVWP